MKTAFPNINEICYEGPKSKNPLAFKHYNAAEIVECLGDVRKRVVAGLPGIHEGRGRYKW